MSDKVFVKDESTAWAILLFVILTVAATLGVYVGVLEHMWPLVGGCGALALAGCVGALWMSAKALCPPWLAPTAVGFAYFDGRSTHALGYTDVIDLGFTERSVPTQGPPIVRRAIRLELALAGGPETVRLEQWVNGDAADPLGPALRAALAAVVGRDRAALERGETVTGEGWRLDRSRLSLETPAGERAIALTDVEAVERVDAAVCVWVRGEPEPVCKLPGARRGAARLEGLLLDLRSDRLPATAPERDRDQLAPDGGLGRVVFARDSIFDAVSLWGRVALALVALLIGLALTAHGLRSVLLKRDDSSDRAALFAGPLLLVGAVWGGVWLWANQRTSFTCYARGVVHRTWRGVRTLYYRDIGAFTYSGTRTFVNGGYAGTEVRLAFEPFDSAGGPPVRYRATFKFNDEQLDNLRDFISRTIAGHLLDRLHRGECVPWTSQLTFTAEGLAIRRDEGRGETAPRRVVPYDQFAKHEFKDGVFYLTASGPFDRPVSEPVAQRNFFPGFYLFLLLNGELSGTNGGRAASDNGTDDH
ncbi:hypothetical protein R5W24_006162 [Gemmata sp. JC717]|uniref:hypothetical protein n=1 Tax=Gemmata algarum TaxID=2975278 RepID=UPI0021BB0412|nr:hypothetical protein [Gemmata algarum]MDY3556980.1 hypothetical protein [Gemmata algarum]